MNRDATLIEKTLDGQSEAFAESAHVNENETQF